jgi:hypothetical protein
VVISSIESSSEPKLRMENIFELLKGGFEVAQAKISDLDKKFVVRSKSENASLKNEFHNKKPSSKLS